MKQEENKYSRIQYFLWLVAGSEISVLKICPNDYNRHANIGLMIIITSLFAGMTAFIAGSTFEKENTTGVVIFAFVWDDCGRKRGTHRRASPSEVSNRP